MANFLKHLNEDYLNVINDFMYGKFLIFLLILCGLYFTIRTKGLQIRLFPESIRCVKEKGEEGKISSFQALMVATASRVGTGNIAGVTTAVVLGGAGSIFWMWVMAIIGGASAFIESTLAQVYKEKDGDTYKGGPAYYIQRALKMRWLGIIFAIFLIATFGFGFNGLQSFTIASAFQVYINDFANTSAPYVIGGLLALFAAVMFFGGAKVISRISSILVPIMAALYILVGLVIFFMNLDKVPTAFKSIFQSAFDFKAIFGGFAGSCMVFGIKRGLFSNEAGMGSAPNAAATAHVSHPAKQGLVQVLSVFIDTIVICTTTAFIVLLAGPLGAVGTDGELLNGIPFVQEALRGQFGAVGIHFVTVCIVLFAATSIIGNFYYVEINIKYISQNKIFMNIMKIFAVAVVFTGAIVNMQTAWNMADIIMGCMAIINIIAIVLLGKRALLVAKDYELQKKAGKNPVFKAADVGITDTDYWK